MKEVKNTMNKELLELQKQFAKMYENEDYGLVGMQKENLQVTGKRFREIVDESGAEIKVVTDRQNYIELQIEVEGVLVITLV